MNHAAQTDAPAAPTTTGPQDVNAALRFIVPGDDKPVFHSAAYTGDAPKIFFDTVPHAVTIHDMRPFAGRLSLDREGFDLRDAPTAAGDLYDDAVVEDRYYREIEDLLRTATGASRVAIFDVTRRKAGGEAGGGVRGPANRVHVDYTEGSGPKRLRDVIGAEEFDRVRQAGGHAMQVNVWRPIRGPVQRAPLALADASSVRPEHLVATDQVFPDRTGEIYHLVHDAGQRWYYAPDMQRDEVLLIKSWDSRADGRARFTPHGAFELPETEADAPPRESIEVRTFLVFDA